MSETPLNGTKTHPLTEAARTVIARLAKWGPIPRQDINAGIANRLERGPEPLAEAVMLPSPFKAHRGRSIQHLQLTEAGRRVSDEGMTK